MTLLEILAEIRCAPWTYYVYGIHSPDGALFYVGQGKGCRVRGHHREAVGRWKDTARTHKVNRIAALIAAGTPPTYSIDSWHQTREGALAREAELILDVGREDLGTGPLLNLSSGGEGATPGPGAARKIAAAKAAWHAAHPEESAAIQRAAAAARGPEWSARNAEGQRRWNETHPEARIARAETRRARQAEAARDGRIAAGVRRARAADPTIVVRQAETLARWHAAHPEHMERMAARARETGAYEKCVAGLKRWRLERPDLYDASKAKHDETCRAPAFRALKSAQARAFLASMTPEARAAHLAAQAAKRAAAWAARTPEERAAVVAKRVATMAARRRDSA